MTSPFKESKHLSIPFQDILEATKNFSTVIGRGGYGPVYKGQLSLSGELTTVAVKRLLIDNRCGQGLKEFLTEIHLFSTLKHPNLVSLVGFCEEGDEKVLIYEYASKGSLDRFLTLPKTPCPLTWKQRLHICIDAAQGLDYLHNGVAQHHRIIHRDIKSSNILLDQNMKAMISDLGLSKIGRANEMVTFLITSPSGTGGYCDPVYISTGVLTKESDIYSFGVVLFEVLCGRMCVINVNNEHRFLTYLAQKYFKEQKLDDIVDPHLKNQIDSNSYFTFLKIAYECLREDRETRPLIATVVRTLKDALKFQVSSSFLMRNDLHIEI